MENILYLDNLTIQDLRKIQELLQRPALEEYLAQFTEEENENEVVLINKLDFPWLKEHSKVLLGFSTLNMFSESELRLANVKKPTFTEEGAIRGLKYLLKKTMSKK